MGRRQEGGGGNQGNIDKAGSPTQSLGPCIPPSKISMQLSSQGGSAPRSHHHWHLSPPGLSQVGAGKLTVSSCHGDGAVKKPISRGDRRREGEMGARWKVLKTEQTREELPPSPQSTKHRVFSRSSWASRSIQIITTHASAYRGQRTPHKSFLPSMPCLWLPFPGE